MLKFGGQISPSETHTAEAGVAGREALSGLVEPATWSHTDSSHEINIKISLDPIIEQPNQYSTPNGDSIEMR